MSLGSRLQAAMYDRMLRKTEAAGLQGHRESLLAQAHGRVLEIGAGTGRNLSFYPADAELTLVEPEAPMARRLEKRVADEGRAVELVRAPAEELPFPDDSFDVVVSTLVLCTVGDQARALAEARRVLKPGGRLLFIEHHRSDDPALARRQDRMNPLNRIVARCDCNRTTIDAIRDAGFTIDELEHDELKHVPSFVSPMSVGAAVTNGA
jgi:ubiquinone/menaquinone biosynthesis C-methylase UbiE